MATRKVHAKYQEIIDLNTVDNTVSVIGIHTPTGDTPRRMFPGFFQQYRKWKYHGCSVTAVNPAQLPLDPLSIGYEPGEGNDAVMDQRDALNPVLFHGCHGEDLGAILNSLYANADTPSVYQYTDSIDGFNEDGTNPADAGRSDMLEGLYYKSLTDCTWKKFNPQAGLRLRGLHPLVYQVASNHPMYPSSLGGNMELDGDNGVIPEIDGLFRTGSNNFHFITPKLQRLGWMDTRVSHVDPSVIAEFSDKELDYNGWMERMKAIENWAELEKLFMGVILLPPSYRYKQFFRFVITHYFSFAGFRGASLLPDPLGAPSMFHGEYNSIGEPIESQDASIGGHGGVDPGPTPVPSYDFYYGTFDRNITGFTLGNVTVPDCKAYLRLGTVDDSTQLVATQIDLSSVTGHQGNINGSYLIDDSVNEGPIGFYCDDGTYQYLIWQGVAFLKQTAGTWSTTSAKQPIFSAYGTSLAPVVGQDVDVTYSEVSE